MAVACITHNGCRPTVEICVTICVITHKNGKKIAMNPADTINKLNERIELHKNLAIGYAQALKGEGISSNQLKKKLIAREKALKAKYD